MIKGIFLLIIGNVPFYMIVILIKVDVVSKNKITSFTCNMVLRTSLYGARFIFYYKIII